MSDTEQDRDRVIDWLLDGDPGIRWQVMRDLAHSSQSAWRREQEKVATEGWGARLLSHQDEEGRWTPRLYGKKWISTTYTMVLLRRMGLPRSEPRALASCRLFLREGQGTRRNSEMCIQAMVTALFYWFDVDEDDRAPVLEYVLSRQLDDGGWNCEAQSRHGSFHTTSAALEALREAAAAGAPTGGITEAEARGREFLLRHGMFRSHRTGEIVDRRYLRFSFPPRWHYDVLRGLDYFQAAGAMDDDRLAEAVGVVIERRRADGTWPLQQRWPGETWFEMETVGEPSRWNTLRATRVLDGWEARK
jgi:hypothetical protein